MSERLTTEQVDYFLHPRCVRERSLKLFNQMLSGAGHWNIDLEQLPNCADYVVATIKKNYPSFEIPFHSRRGHLRAGGIDRVAKLRATLSEEERLIAEYDLIITSVFVDAGAGDVWTYKGTDGKSYNRSEGLAVASYDAFEQGLYTTSKERLFQVTPDGLNALSKEAFENCFQSTESNPLLGIDTRLQMLKKLASCMHKGPEFFLHNGRLRLGHIGHYLKKQSKNSKLQASEILKTVLLAFEHMWPERQKISPIRFGDIWNYSRWSQEPRFDSLIAFHKLSQWLSYSLMEALQDEGIEILNLDDLTGLPEYRNGGLLIDLKVIQAKDPSTLSKGLSPDDDAILEWRAATVTLLDRLAPLVRERLGMNAQKLPLVKILEGGTWSAGRRSAQEFRNTSASPINIISDGSVF